MICAVYTDNYEGEEIYPTKSSFTIKGYDLEVKKWELPSRECVDSKLLCTLYLIEHSPRHPAVMGKMEVYENGQYREWLNPWFEDKEIDNNGNKLLEAMRKIINK